jgi:hypothetical protein
VSRSLGNDDPLLWLLRRSLVEAKSISVRTMEDHRRALVLTAEIRGHIRLLTERLGFIENEMQSVTRRIGALNAYHRTANIGRLPVRRRGKGVN